MKLTKETQFMVGAGASTSFFVLTLLYTMSVFFFAFASGSSFLGVYGGLMGHPGGGGGLAGAPGLLQIVLILLSLIPSILICSGLWLLCFALRNQSGGAIGYLVLIKGAVIAQFALMFTLIAVIEAALFVSLPFVRLPSFPLAERITSGLSQIVSGFALFALLAAAGGLAIYLIFILRTLGMAIGTLRAGERRGFVPMPLILINSAFALLNLVCAGMDASRGNMAASAASVCAGFFLIGLAALLTVVRREG
ncbi:MAG: hypothetical protein FWG72_02280 [Oscillospiraceae bacterium]|nr:hypothetical protein [Oscillospiraceae bacterium]